MTAGQNGSSVTLSLAPNQARSRDRARTGVLIVLMAQLMLVLDATVVNVALPRIDADLGFGPASLEFEIRAFVDSFDKRSRVQHDINLAVNRALLDNGIRIA